MENTPIKDSVNGNVNLYDNAKLEEIIQNADMYNADLVQKCQAELEIRKMSTQMESKVNEFDDARIQEILDSPSIYSQELLRSCEREKTRRRDEILKKEKQEEEERRLLYEQREMERKEDLLSWLRKSGLIILGVAIVFGGIVYFSDSYVTKLKRAKAEEKEKMEQLEAQRMEAERMEKARMEEERKIAEAKAKRLEIEKKRKEDTKAAIEREKQRLIEGPFEIGEYHKPTGAVIVCLDGTKKHGVVMTMEYREGFDKNWQQSMAKDGWRFPTKEEVKSIWENDNKINKTINEKSGSKNCYYRGAAVYFYTDNGLAYAYDGWAEAKRGYTRLVKDF